jgi:response regulator RpfG family c-di-GMP phosphodiesterase
MAMTPSGEPHDQLRVLLIDPFLDESEMYAEYLRSAGFDVVVPPNPAVGLQLADQDPPDAVVTRLRQGDAALDGMEVLRRLKRNRTTRHVPVVIITTSINRSDAQAAAGRCDAYLLLPVMPDELAAQIRRVCRDNRASRRKGKPAHRR